MQHAQSNASPNNASPNRASPNRASPNRAFNRGQERRKHARFSLPAMYSKLAVRTLDSETFQLEGHAYDISLGGVRFELDRGIEPGTGIAIRIDLPHTGAERSTERRSVFVFANVVWIEDEDVPGPVRMAAVFSRFARQGDEELLRRRIYSGRYAMAA